MPSHQNIRVEFEDNDLQERVERFMLSRGASAFRELRTHVDNGRVTLSGSVATFYDKQVALTTCQHVAGVLMTIDQIDVRESAVSTKPR